MKMFTDLYQHLIVVVVFDSRVECYKIITITRTFYIDQIELSRNIVIQ